MSLTSQAVSDIFLDCLLADDEVENGQPKDGIDWIPADGVRSRFGFVKPRLESHREEVRSLLAELDDTFDEGWAFQNLPFDKYGRQWGEHKNAEQLLALACGLGMGERIDVGVPGMLPYFRRKIRTKAVTP